MASLRRDRNTVVVPAMSSPDLAIMCETRGKHTEGAEVPRLTEHDETATSSASKPIINETL